MHIQVRWGTVLYLDILIGEIPKTCHTRTNELPIFDLLILGPRIISECIFLAIYIVAALFAGEVVIKLRVSSTRSFPLKRLLQCFVEITMIYVLSLIDDATARRCPCPILQIGLSLWVKSMLLFLLSFSNPCRPGWMEAECASIKNYTNLEEELSACLAQFYHIHGYTN